MAYGGKTREEEEHGSIEALAWVLIYAGVALLILAIALAWWLL